MIVCSFVLLLSLSLVNPETLSQPSSFSNQSLRLLQDNPSNPTGPNMGTIPGIVPLTLQALTASIINRIAQQTNQSTAGNYQLIGPSISQNITIPLPQTPNITIQITNPQTVSNARWTPTTVQSLHKDASWISARGLLSRLNISYASQNQIISIQKQLSSFSTNFNLTFVSIRGYIEAVVSVTPNLISSLASLKYLNSTVTAVNTSSQRYQIIQSLLRNIFYDFTKSPLTLINGTTTTVSNLLPIIYNLNYQSATGIYGFTVKTIGDKMYVLGCNLISVRVDTQTVPVVATINLLNVDGNFEFVNSTVRSFLEDNSFNGAPVYQKVIIWTNRGGNQLVYYLTAQLGFSNYDICVLFNLTSRTTNIAYFKNNSVGAVSTETFPTTSWKQVTFLSQVNNQTFLAIDLAARMRYPVNVVGPVVKVETKIGGKGADYRLSYLGNGKEVTVEYQQP